MATHPSTSSRQENPMTKTPDPELVAELDAAAGIAAHGGVTGRPAVTYTPRPLTISADPANPDRYQLTYDPTADFAEPDTYTAVRWHDAVLALEFQRPSWRGPSAPFHAPHPTITEILDDVRNHHATGIATVTVTAEPRPVIL